MEAAAQTATVTMVDETSGSVAEGSGLTKIFTLRISQSQSWYVPVRLCMTTQVGGISLNTICYDWGLYPGQASRTLRVFANHNSFDRPATVYTYTISEDTDMPLPAGVSISAMANTVTYTARDIDPTVVSLARADTGAVSEGDKVAFTVTLGRALVAGETIDVPLSVGGTGVTTSDWSLAKQSGASNTGVGLSGAGTATPVVRLSGAGARTATLELTPALDTDAEGSETYTVALGPDGTGANGFDRAGLGTNVGGGADPHGTQSSFDVQVDDAPDPATLTLADEVRAPDTEGSGRDHEFVVQISQPQELRIPFRLCATTDRPGLVPGRCVVRGIPRLAPSTTYTFPAFDDDRDTPDLVFTLTVEEDPDDPLPAWVSIPATADSDTFTLRDDDPTVVSLDRTGKGDVVGGDKVAFTVVLGRALVAGETIDVPLSVGGTGVTPDDWSLAKQSGASNTGVSLLRANTATPAVRFSGAGARTATLELTPALGTDAEGSELFTVALGPDGTGANGFDRAGLGTNVGGGADPHDSANGFDMWVYGTGELRVSVFRHVLSEGDTVAIKVTVSPPRPAAFTLDYTVSSHSGASGADVVGGFGTRSVTVPANAGSVTLSVETVQDKVQGEGFESFRVELSTSEARIVFAGPTTIDVTIKDDDGRAPSVSFASGASRGAEGSGAHTVAVKLSSAPAGDITLHYGLSGTAALGSDYTIDGVTGARGTVTVPAGVTTAAVAVTLVDDGTHEGDETVVLTLAGGEGYRIARERHTLTIADDDALLDVSFAAGSQRAGEGSGTRDVTVNLSPPATDEVTLSYSVRGTATPGSDYAPLSGTVTVDAGAATAVIPVAIADDSAREGAETVVLALDGGAGYTVGRPGTHTLTIAASDGPPSWSPVRSASLASPASRVGEGAGTHEVTVNLSPPPPRDITLGLRFVGGTDYEARLDSDYTVSGERTSYGRILFPVPAGTPAATVPITIVDDSAREGDERLLLDVWVAGSGSAKWKHTLTILDNDGPSSGSVPAASFATDSQGAQEKSGTRNVVVNLRPAPSSGITLDYGVGGTATSGSDYAPLSGTVTVPAGAETATIAVAIEHDGAQEASETVVLTLATGTGYTVGRPGTHTLTIADNAPEPKASFATGSQRADEGSGTRNVVVNLHPAPSESITLNYGVGGTATSGSDYTALSGTVTVDAGAETAVIPVAIVDDGVAEASETLVLTLGRGSGYSVGARGRHVLTIGAMPAVSFAWPMRSADEGSGTHNVALHLRPAPSEPLAVRYRVGGTALPGPDYAVLPGTVTVPAHATAAVIPVAIVDDSVEDSVETVELTLVDGSGYSVGRRWRSHTLFIVNHDPDDLQGLIRARIDEAAKRGDAAAANLWRRALAAVRTTRAPGGLEALGAAEAQALAGAHVRGGDIETAALWYDIARVIGDGTPAPVTVSLSAEHSSIAESNGETKFTIALSRALEAGETATVPFTVTGAKPYKHWNIGFRPVDSGPGVARTATGRHSAVTFTQGGQTAVLVLSAVANDDDRDRTVRIAFGTDARAPSATGIAGGVTPAGKALAVAIVDDDKPGLAVSLAAEHSSIAEANGETRFTIALSRALGAGETAVVPFTVTGGAPNAHWNIQFHRADSGPGVERTATGRRSAVRFTQGGQTATLVLIARPNADTEERTIAIAFGTDSRAPSATGVEGGIAPAGDAIAVAIVDDDSPGEPEGRQDSEPVPTLALAGAGAVTEGAGADFTLTAAPPPASDLAVTLRITRSGDTVAPSDTGERTVTLAGGTATKTVTVATVDDAADAPDGALTATVVAVGDAPVESGASATVEVTDDDATAVTLSAPAGDIAEADGRKTLTVTLGRALVAGETLTVPLTLGGTATPGSDYTLAAPDATPQGVRYAHLASTDPASPPALTFTGPSVTSATLLLTANADASDEGAGERATVALGTLTATGLGGGAAGSGSASFAIVEPAPEVSIAAQAASVTEGAEAVFTVRASRAPDTDLTVKLAVSEGAGGDFVAAADEGDATVTIAKGATEAAFSVATVNDAADEPDGALTATVAADGEGDARYRVAPAPHDAATVAVADDDAPAPALSVGDATVTEGAGLMWFTIRLGAPSKHTVSVSYRTRESTPVSAQQGRDYLAASWNLDFRAGETEKRVWVLVYDDSHDEEAETFEFVLWSAHGAPIADGVGVGTIVNDDPMPAAWLARFGRTVAEQALDGIAGRIAAPRHTGMQGTLAGQALTFEPSTTRRCGSGRRDARHFDLRRDRRSGGRRGRTGLRRPGRPVRRPGHRHRPRRRRPLRRNAGAIAHHDGARRPARQPLLADRQAGRRWWQPRLVGPRRARALRRPGGDVLARRRGDDGDAGCGLCQGRVARRPCARAERGRGRLCRQRHRTPALPRRHGRGDEAGPVRRGGARGRRHGRGVADGGHPLRIASGIGAHRALGRTRPRHRRGDAEARAGRELQDRHHMAHGGGGLAGRPDTPARRGLRPGTRLDLGCAVGAHLVGEDARPRGIGVRRDAAAARPGRQLSVRHGGRGPSDADARGRRASRRRRRRDRLRHRARGRPRLERPGARAPARPLGAHALGARERRAEGPGHRRLARLRPGPGERAGSVAGAAPGVGRALRRRARCAVRTGAAR